MNLASRFDGRQHLRKVVIREFVVNLVTPAFVLNSAHAFIMNQRHQPS